MLFNYDFALRHLPDRRRRFPAPHPRPTTTRVLVAKDPSFLETNPNVFEARSLVGSGAAAVAMVSYAKWDNFKDSDSESDAEQTQRVAAAQLAVEHHNPIPNIITQTSKDGFPHADDWRVVNGAVADDEFLMLLYRDKEARAFVTKDYPWFADTYEKLGHGVERADLFRYLAIHHSAGYYADTDVMPLAPVGEWLSRYGWEHGKDNFNAINLLVVGIEFPWEADGNPFQLCQWTFAASRPQHPVIYACASAAVDNVKAITYSKDTITKRTGPVAFTKAIVDFLRANDCGGAVDALAKDFAEPRGKYIPLTLDSAWGLLVLPYRAFGYHPGPFHAQIAKEKHARALVTEPASQRLIQHEFKGSWR